jgi:uncharacterized protein with gpF-like domain
MRSNTADPTVALRSRIDGLQEELDYERSENEGLRRRLRIREAQQAPKSKSIDESLKAKPTSIPPIRTSVRIEDAYRKRLEQMLDTMHADVEKEVRSLYKSNEPTVRILAEDALPSVELQALLKRLAAKWNSRFAKLSNELAKWFATASADRSDIALKRMLRKGGMSVKFTMSPAMRDVVKAVVAENVSLIRSIPQQHLLQVEGMVMRSIQAGRMLGPLVHDLQHQFGVTRHRAEFIARDQANKATSMLSRVRHLELGFQKAIWLHSHSGKEPRPTHVANDKKEFDLQKGWYDPDPRVRAYILPGVLPNCRCTFKPLISGVS